MVRKEPMKSMDLDEKPILKIEVLCSDCGAELTVTSLFTSCSEKHGAKITIYAIKCETCELLACEEAVLEEHKLEEK